MFRAHGFSALTRGRQFSRSASHSAFKRTWARSSNTRPALPFPDAKFDLIFAFSIFTHLSQRAALAAARVCSAALSDRGLFIATIRPKSIIADLRENAARMLADYEYKGFAFLSNSSLTPIDGDISYGVAVVSVDYMARNWPFLEVVDVEFDLIDPMQIRVAFRKSTSVRE